MTYYNDLPSMVQAIHASIDPSVHIDVEMLVTGGAALMDRIEDKRLQEVIAGGNFNVVVLQDRGGYPLCADTDKECLHSKDAIAKSAQLVREAGAQPIWFSTWQKLPAAQTALSNLASELANKLQIAVADVGKSMAAAKEQDANIPLWQDDGHPAALGSWVAAATIVRTQLNSELPPLMLPNACRTQWQQGYLTAQLLASQQTKPAKDCSMPSQEQQEQIRKAANHSFKTKPLRSST